MTHVFFHSLIMDTAKLLMEIPFRGYNSVMTTKDEFLKILDAFTMTATFWCAS
ncbi:MAG: hypothetical protein ACLTMD_14245 [Clostridium sp.]